MTELEIINAAFAKLGGAGGQYGAKPFLPNLTATDTLTTQAVALLPRVRKRVIKDLAIREAPFKETLKFADLGTELTQSDIAIENIEVSGTTVTVTTEESHGLSTGDTRYLTGIRGTGGIEALNNTLKTLTIVDTTSFTLDSTTGSGNWVYTDGGIISLVPEIGGYEYAFNLPSDCLMVVAQKNEAFVSIEEQQQTYRYDTLLNRSSNGLILITNNLSNIAGDSAFIHYVIDQATTTNFSLALIDCLVSLFAAEVCTMAGKDLKMREAQLQEYAQISIPDAMKYNLSQFNNQSKTTGNYLGDRA
ncbi:MAG: hypothetical protein PHQ00_02230 [Phycisphaerae bacterium]|nr:hypothetical protein [Phycisphaerae bacterium]